MSLLVGLVGLVGLFENLLILGEREQANLFATLVDVGLVLDWVWNEFAVVLDLELRAVELVPLFRDQHAVGQVSDLLAGDLPFFQSGVHQLEALSLKVAIVVR